MNTGTNFKVIVLIRLGIKSESAATRPSELLTCNNVNNSFIKMFHALCNNSFLDMVNK